MRKLIRFIVVCALLVCFMLTATGCGTVIPDADNLMRPPRAGDDGQEILDALEQSLGTPFSLRYPIRGKNQAAVMRADLNGDRTDEAVVFYRLVGESSGARFAVLEKESEWRVIYTGQPPAGNSGDVDMVLFADLEGDGVSEMIIGWQTPNGRVLSAYLYVKGEAGGDIIQIPVAADLIGYDELCAADFDGDGKDELIAAVIREGEASANLIRYREGGLVSSDAESCMLGGVYGFVYNIVGQLAPEVIVTVLGGYYGAHYIPGGDCPVVTPRPVVWDFAAGKLAALDSVGIGHAANNRPSDINGDGFLEIPSDEIFGYYVNNPAADPIYLTNWHRFTAAGESGRPEAARAATRIRFVREGFTLDCPESWLGEVTPVREKEENAESDRVIYFYRNADDGGGLGEELFRIRLFSHDAWSALEPLDAVGGFGFRDDDPDPHFEMLGENSHAVFACMIAEGQAARDMGITVESLVAAFRAESGAAE